MTEAIHKHGTFESRLKIGETNTELYNRRLKTHESVQRIRASSAGQLARKEALRCLPLPAALLLLGAGLEFSMINWTVGETNFCETATLKTLLLFTNTEFFHADRTFKRRQAKNYVEEQQHLQARAANNTN